VPDCLPPTQQFLYGHNPNTNTYVTPFANPAIGDFIGAVQTMQITVRCKYSPGASAAGIYFRHDPDIYPAGLTAKHGYLALPAQVYTTASLAARGIGFTIHWFDQVPYVSGNASSFGSSIGTPGGDGYHTSLYQFNYRFIKINNNFAFGFGALSNVPFDILRYSVSDGYIQGQYYYEQSVSPVIFGVSVTIPEMTIAQRTCMTPYVEDGVVSLPTITPNDLPQIGSLGPPVTFQLRMNCPPHLGYVGYYVVPVHGIVNQPLGVIAINPNSQAKGIGLQIEIEAIVEPNLDWSFDPYNPVFGYHPMQFGLGKNYKFSAGYFKNALPSGTQGEPLTASETYQAQNIRVAVRRTGTVVPGKFTSAIWVHIVYK